MQPEEYRQPGGYPGVVGWFDAAEAPREARTVDGRQFVKARRRIYRPQFHAGNAAEGKLCQVYFTRLY